MLREFLPFFLACGLGLKVSASTCYHSANCQLLCSITANVRSMRQGKAPVRVWER
jgi:hypothetical protein